MADTLRYFLSRQKKEKLIQNGRKDAKVKDKHSEKKAEKKAEKKLSS